MNITNTQKLYTDFPRLYRDATSNESCMKWGFSCGDGWFDLVYKLSGDIEAEATVLGLDPASDAWPRALQVKEKFATLKFYCSAGEERDESEFGVEVVGQLMSLRPVPNAQSIQPIIRAAENLSAAICEDCGCPGALNRSGGWWRTVCDKCEAERIAEKTDEGKKAIPQRPAQEHLKILAEDMALWWINAGNYRHPIDPSFSATSDRALSVDIARMTEAVVQGNIQRVMDCLDSIEGKQNMDSVSAEESQAIDEYVAPLRELALAVQESREPDLENAHDSIIGVLAG